MTTASSTTPNLTPNIKIPSITDEYGKQWDVYMLIPDTYKMKKSVAIVNGKYYIPKNIIPTGYVLVDTEYINLALYFNAIFVKDPSLDPNVIGDITKYIPKPAILQDINIPGFYNSSSQIITKGDKTYYYLNHNAIVYQDPTSIPPTTTTPTPTNAPTTTLTLKPTTTPLPSTKNIEKYDKYTLTSNDKLCAEGYLKINTAPLGSIDNPLCVRQYTHYDIDQQNGLYVLNNNSYSSSVASSSTPVPNLDPRIKIMNDIDNKISKLANYDKKIFFIFILLIIISIIISIISLILNN